MNPECLPGVATEPLPFEEAEHVLSEEILRPLLRESEEAFWKVFEDNPLGMILSRLNFRITKVNNAFCGMIGFTSQELIGRDIRSFVLNEAARFEPETMEKLLSGEARSFELETQFTTKRQRTVWAHITTSIIR